MEGGTWGGRHIQWVGGTYCAGANWKVGSRWVNGEGGRAAWFSVQERSGWGKGGGWVLWGHMRLHCCDTGVKYWEVRLHPASGGQALVV